MKTKNLNLQLLKACFIVLVIGCFFQSCSKPDFPNRQFIVLKSDDDNWTTSAQVYCDSVNMISQNECIYWIDGRSSKLFGQMIKIWSNEDFVSK